MLADKNYWTVAVSETDTARDVIAMLKEKQGSPHPLGLLFVCTNKKETIVEDIPNGNLVLPLLAKREKKSQVQLKLKVIIEQTQKADENSIALRKKKDNLIIIKIHGSGKRFVLAPYERNFVVRKANR
jgi:hypothetical protein